MNIQFGNTDSRNRNHVRIINNNVEYSGSSSNESENSIVSLNLEDAQEEADLEGDEQNYEEEEYREMLVQKRGEVIEDLNVFQYKNVNKFVSRIDE